MRKGSTEMWWIIIGAVIALVVLIILLVLFTGKTGGLEKGLTECEGKGGVCTNSGTKECPGNTLTSTSFVCSDPGAICCLGVPKECRKDDPAACNSVQSDCKGPYGPSTNQHYYCE